MHSSSSVFLRIKLLSALDLSVKLLTVPWFLYFFYTRHSEWVCLREGSSMSSWQWFSGVSNACANTAGLGAGKDTLVSTAADENIRKNWTKPQTSFWRVDFHFYWYTYSGIPSGGPIRFHRWSCRVFLDAYKINITRITQWFTECLNKAL